VTAAAAGPPTRPSWGPWTPVAARMPRRWAQQTPRARGGAGRQGGGGAAAAGQAEAAPEPVGVPRWCLTASTPGRAAAGGGGAAAGLPRDVGEQAAHQRWAGGGVCVVWRLAVMVKQQQITSSGCCLAQLVSFAGVLFFHRHPKRTLGQPYLNKSDNRLQQQQTCARPHASSSSLRRSLRRSSHEVVGPVIWPGDLHRGVQVSRHAAVSQDSRRR